MKHLILLVESGKLSPAEMFEALKLSDNDSDVAQAIEKELEK